MVLDVRKLLQQAARMRMLLAIARARLQARAATIASFQRENQGMNAASYPEPAPSAQARAIAAELLHRVALDAKYPRTMVIAKQANIATNGATQQVNNHAGSAPARAREDGAAAPNERIALENDDGRTILDAGATLAAGSRDPAASALVAVEGAGQRRGKSRQRS